MRLCTGSPKTLLAALILIGAVISPLAVGAAEASVRSVFWVAGSVPDLDGAMREQQRIARRTGMQVQIVPATVDGKTRYRLLVRAADSPANRELQRTNLEYIGVRQPWILRLREPVVADARRATEGSGFGRPDTGAAQPAMIMAAAGDPARGVGPKSAPAKPDQAPGTAATPRAVAPAEPAPAPAPMTARAAEGEAHVTSGIQAYRAHRYRDAVEAFTRAIAAGVNEARVYYFRGFGYNRLHQYERALEDFTRAIELDPEMSDAYNRRGLAHERLGDEEAALRDYKKALELQPANASAIGNRTRVFLFQILPLLAIVLL